MIEKIFTLETTQYSTAPSIYLAGPTYRIIDGAEPPIGWRNKASQILESWEGAVYIPEWRGGVKPEGWTYSRQVDWEMQAMENATVILFWIPRELPVLPAFTTNIEFGEFLQTGKIVVGAPKDAPNNRYIFERCSRSNVPTSHDLETCVLQAINLVKRLRGEIDTVHFTADTHFNHKRTLELSRRPFSSVLEMNSMMIYYWNGVVSRNGTVYHLGDFGDPSYIEHLNGKKIYIVPGNYDKPEILETLTKDPRVEILGPRSSYHIDNNYFTLIHAPEDGKDVNMFYLYGHIHKLQMVKMNGLNVGVDCHNFTPIDENEVMFYRSAVMQHYDDNVFTLGMGMNT